MLKEVSEFVQTLGVPIAGMVALSVVLYKIGTVCGRLLIDAWRAKDTRLGELETRVNTINNGQREALEKRFDAQLEVHRQGNEVMQGVAEAMREQAGQFREWAVTRKCLHDSDAVALVRIVDGHTADPKTLATIERQRRRSEQRGVAEGPAPSKE